MSHLPRTVPEQRHTVSGPNAQCEWTEVRSALLGHPLQMRPTVPGLMDRMCVSGHLSVLLSAATAAHLAQPVKPLVKLLAFAPPSLSTNTPPFPRCNRSGISLQLPKPPDTKISFPRSAHNLLSSPVHTEEASRPRESRGPTLSPRFLQ